MTFQILLCFSGVFFKIQVLIMRSNLTYYSAVTLYVQDRQTNKPTDRQTDFYCIDLEKSTFEHLVRNYEIESILIKICL